MKYLYLLTLCFSALALTSCGGSSGDCEGIPEYTSSSVGAIVVIPIGEGTESEIAAPEDIFFHLQFRPEIVDPAPLSFSLFGKSLSFSLFPKAYATTCVSPKYRETVSEIMITSDADFDADHLAGESLNDVFALAGDDQRIDDFFMTAEISISGLVIWMTALPDLDKTHNIEIEITLDSGSEFSIELEELVFE